MTVFRFALLTLATTLAVAPTAVAQNQEWGKSLKGRIVLDGAVPTRKPLKVDNDIAFCMSKGQVVSDEIVVDPKSKGVRWATVYLIAEDGDFKKSLPVNPAVIKALPKQVILDQPCCMFEPHVVILHSSQTLLAKNSAQVAHNVLVAGTGGQPNLNPLIPAGKMIEIEGFKASPTPIPISCSIHKWMNAWVRVLDHPYHAVTNEKGEFEIKDPPAGKYRLVVWQEAVGWVIGEVGKDPSKMGRPVELKANAVTDLGELKMKPPE